MLNKTKVKWRKKTACIDGNTRILRAVEKSGLSNNFQPTSVGFYVPVFLPLNHLYIYIPWLNRQPTNKKQEITVSERISVSFVYYFFKYSRH